MKTLSKPSVCLLMRQGVQIWIEKDRADNLIQILSRLSGHKFIEYEGRSINTADVSGIFTPEDMADMVRRKNGEWTCQKGNWHTRRDLCNCGRNPKMTVLPAEAPVGAFVPKEIRDKFKAKSF